MSYEYGLGFVAGILIGFVCGKWRAVFERNRGIAAGEVTIPESRPEFENKYSFELAKCNGEIVKIREAIAQALPEAVGSTQTTLELAHKLVFAHCNLLDEHKRLQEQSETIAKKDAEIIGRCMLGIRVMTGEVKMPEPQTKAASDTSGLENCCECGEQYPRSELIEGGHVFCAKCRNTNCKKCGRPMVLDGGVVYEPYCNECFKRPGTGKP